MLDQISKLVADSAESIKRSSVEAANDQLREIKKLRREEPKSFKREGNEIQYKCNLKLQDTLNEVQSHELADNEEDGKNILRAEEWAEKALNYTTFKRPIN